MTLAETKIKAAKYIDRTKGETPYKVTDGRGLCLLITHNSKLWHFRYRFGNKEKLMALGAYPVVSLAAAREAHLEARRVLASGADPMQQRKDDKQAAKIASENSFQSVAEKWHKHWSARVTAHHADDTRRRLEANVFPVIGGRPITEITPRELRDMVQEIERKGDSRELAKRALETCGQIFRFAISHDIAERNPAAEIKPKDVLKPTQRVNFARVDGKELGDLLRAIEVYRGAPITRLAMKLLALTFVRTSELIEARWSEFDLDACRWNIPAERMKMKSPHIVPLSRQAVEVLRMLHMLTGQYEFVFPGDRNPKRPMSNNTILKALERMGYKGKHTGHGFRGVASTLLHEQGYDHAHIELQLAHAPRNAVSAAYNHARCA